MLHVAQISFFDDPEGRAPEELLIAWPSLVDVADCAARAGVRVSVIQASRHSYNTLLNGVSYHFLPFGRAIGADGMSDAFAALVRELDPNVLHVHSLGFPRDVLSLAALAPDIPIVLQDHADRVPRFWRKPLWRRGLCAAAGIAFCSLQQARPFAAAGLLRPQTRLYDIPESTSRFTPGDREQARRNLGVAGDPLLLWVGHLNDNKDPLTVLEGVSKAARTLPGLQLWCCFGTAPLLDPVRQWIAADPLLRDRVHLLGRVSHEKIEQLMHAADLFVLGSRREGSGYALLEALACGVPTVVTDIPPFRSLTADGAVGALWRTGDAQDLCRALLAVAPTLGSKTRQAVRAHFERELSFEAVGAKLAFMYEDLLERKRGRRVLRGAEVDVPMASS